MRVDLLPLLCSPASSYPVGGKIRVGPNEWRLLNVEKLCTNVTGKKRHVNKRLIIIFVNELDRVSESVNGSTVKTK